jgi:hypothetical protein
LTAGPEKAGSGIPFHAVSLWPNRSEKERAQAAKGREAGNRARNAQPVTVDWDSAITRLKSTLGEVYG